MAKPILPLADTLSVHGQPRTRMPADATKQLTFVLSKYVHLFMTSHSVSDSDFW